MIMEKIKNDKRISFTAIAVSFVFLFNPSISIIDFLPDFIGYIILTAALTNLADLNDTFWEAQKKFKFLIILDACKMFALIWSFALSNGAQRNSSILLWSFVFVVFDMIFLVPALLKLFSGMIELGLVYDSSFVIKERVSKSGRAKKNPTASIRALTIMFIVFKNVVTLLPELTELTSSYYWEYMINPPAFDLYRYVGALRFLAIMLVLAFGIVWLVSIIRYFKKVNKDEKFIGALNVAYTERVLPKKGLFIMRRTNIAGYLFLAAIVLSLDFRFDGVNIIPDILIVPIVAVLLSILAKSVEVCKVRKVLLCALSAVFFAAYYVSDIIFGREFYNNDFDIIWRSEKATSMYIVNLVLALLSAVCFVLLARLVLNTFKKVAEQGTVADGDGDSFAKENLAMLKKRINICFIIVCAYALTDVCYAAFSKAFGAMFLFNTVAAIVLFIAFFNFYLMLASVLKFKYKFE